MTIPRPTRRRARLRAWVVAAAVASAGACGSESAPRTLAIQSVTPLCTKPGETLTITLANVPPSQCASAKITLGESPLENLGQTRASPLTLQARLPAGFAPADAELLVACESGPAARVAVAACPGPDGGVDARRQSPDAAPLCAGPIRAVVLAVDDRGRPFPRDRDGIFLVPHKTADFSFATDGSEAISARNVTYTFTSDCYPKVTVGAPVLGGLSVMDLVLGQLCDFKVEVTDHDCPGAARTGSAMGMFMVVP